jgi:hemolysin activation/secretion protein
VHLLLAQDVPGVTVPSVLRPSTEEPGALILIAQVSRNWYSGLLTADNRGAPFTGPEQGLAVVSLNSFSEYGERTELSIFRSFNDTQIFGQAAIEVFLGSSGLKLRLFGGSGTADPSGNLRAIGYHGVTSTGGVQLSYPVIRTRQQTLNVFGSFDILESNITTGFSPPAIASRDNLRVVRLGADYVRQDNWLGAEFSAVNAASLRVSKGTPTLGASRNGDIRAGRLNERVDFGRVNFEASRTQTLLTFGDNSSFALQGTVAGQYSPDVLPAAEKFFLGGPRWNRGYYSGEVTGDNAVTAAVELQYNTGFTVDVLSAPREISAQLYSFYDWGETWENQKTDANHRLQSYGVGARVSVTRWTEFNVEGVHRLVRRPQGASSNATALKSNALYWRVLTRF